MNAKQGDVLPLRPVPVKCWVNHVRARGVDVTAIGRRWKSGDSGPRGTCRLCPECTAHDDGCLVTVVGLRVDRKDAPLFSLAALSDAWEQLTGVAAVQGVRHA